MNNNQNPYAGMNPQMQQPMMGQQPNRRDINEMQLRKKISETEQSICGEVFMVIFFSIFLGLDWNRGCMKANRTSVLVFLAYLIIYRIPINVLCSYTLRTYKKETYAVLGCGFLSKTFLTGWMLYSMITYFGVGPEVCGRYWPMFIYLAYGFYVLIQACIFGCVG